MFCSNCGNKLAAGEKFCSVCGAKVGDGTEQPVRRDNKEGSFGRYEAPRSTPARSFEARSDNAETEARAPHRSSEEDVSFDWSSVIDESHKKKTPDIRSPWDPEGLEENERNETVHAVNSGKERSVEDRVFDDARNSKPDSGRTMSFIDMLKQEREDKERKADDEARKATAPRTTQDDFSAFDKAGDFGYSETVLPKNDREYTRGYTDLKRDVVAGLDKDEDDGRHAPADFDSQLAYIRARKDAKAVEAPEPPRSFINDENKVFSEDDNRAARAGHDAEAAAAGAKAPAQSAKGDLEAELAEILGMGNGMKDRESTEPFEHEAPEVHEAPEEDRYAFDDEYRRPVHHDEDTDLFDEDSSENDYLDYSPRVGRAARAASMEDNEFRGNADEYDEYDEYDEPEGHEEVAAQEPAADPETEKASATSEIEALQKRLAELLGQKEEEPEDASNQYLSDDDAFFNVDLPDNEDNEESFAYEDEAETAEPAEEPASSEDYAFGEEDSAEEFTFDDVTEAVEEPESFEDESSYVQETEAVAEAPAVEEAAPPEEPDNEQLDLESELSALGFDVDEPSVIMDRTPAEEDMLFTDDTLDTTSDADDTFDGEEAENDAMSIDELENDLFGNEAKGDDLEATRKIEKFYTLYRKNEEFQQLLDAEYNKLKNGEDFDLMDGDLESLVDNNEIPEEEEAAQNEVPEAANDGAEAKDPSATQEILREELNQAAQDQHQAVTEQVPVMQRPAAPVVDEAQTAPVADDAEEGEGKGGVLTVLAIIVAILLVCLLAVILILSFAPESGIASQLNQVIDNFSKLISANDGDASFLL